MTDTLHDSAGSHESNTLTISVLEDLRGDGCSYTTDPTVINNVLADFSGDPSVKLELSQDPTCEGLIMTLTDRSEQLPSISRMHSNRIGYTERDEGGWVWYSRGDIKYI
jgi:hypothetical protein